MPTARELGTRVRELREALGLTQTTLAHKLGYARSIRNSPISKLERGELNITLDKLLLLAEVLGVTVAELFAPAKGAAPRLGPRDRRAVRRTARLLTTPDPAARAAALQALLERLTPPDGKHGHE